jgi:RNA polymerase sigma factor (sigma-70 family)
MRAGTEPAPAVDRTAPPPQDFADLYDAYFPDIYRYVAGRLGRDLADDIAADTFLIALRKWDSFDFARGAVRPWLYGIATHLLAQHRRKETRRYRALARMDTGGVVDSHEARVVSWVAAEGLQPQLARALAALSTGERDVLLLVALCDLSHDEVAQALEIPYGTVGSRLSRARKKVRTALGHVLGQEGQIDG